MKYQYIFKIKSGKFKNVEGRIFRRHGKYIDLYVCSDHNRLGGLFMVIDLTRDKLIRVM